MTGGGRKRSARCPAHDDTAPSLSVTEGESRVLIRCHAGCDVDTVLGALKLTKSDLFDVPKERRANGSNFNVVATYGYVDENSQLLYEVLRLGNPKSFRQRRPDCRGGWEWNLNGTRRVLFRLPRVIAAVKAGAVIYVPEGEKDVLAIEGAGGVATCNSGGAGPGKWRAEYGDVLRGTNVVIIADRDKPGRAHAVAILADLTGKARSVRVVEPAVGNDVSDHLDAGRTLDELVPVDFTDQEKHGQKRQKQGVAPSVDSVDASEEVSDLRN